MRRLLHIAAIAAVALTACNSSGCLDNGNTLPLAGFYNAETRKSISVSALEIRGIGAPGDSVLLSPGHDVSEVYMPLRATAPEVSWIFDYTADGLPERYNDTVTFRYETIPYFASEACGAMYIYRVERLDYTRHVIDSIGLTDSIFNNVDVERIRIYFSAAEEGQSL